MASLCWTNVVRRLCIMLNGRIAEIFRRFNITGDLKAAVLHLMESSGKDEDPILVIVWNPAELQRIAGPKQGKAQILQAFSNAAGCSRLPAGYPCEDQVFRFRSLGDLFALKTTLVTQYQWCYGNYPNPVATTLMITDLRKVVPTVDSFPMFY
ncbi:hypothetical protein SELMODRAFT_428243 [Selaginella moellendorffii]|uniref:Uncharacterized protein n=1 Tax=Selaginella moellendorffii TaxID=88036 RepID=D8T273_SELML|nr:uncharacterized protein LOC9637643 [Selaginella moellendorffii]EFJ09212.1 hypothetical protein SELMODRAFT_428243 [Selaginella moellendorffii]|eukprot:XP_002989735.1 uncharacterized protein LOC9637643 [Selaginella moellendorffii]